ncbi:MAG: DUF3052 family protein [Solirubrobacteraceae bacterium]
MAGYSKTPLWKKLGIREGDKLLLLDAPAKWKVPELPSDVTSTVGSARGGDEHAADLILAFFATRAQLIDAIPALAPRIFPDGAIWAVWPRRAGGHHSDIREQDIRDVALPLGLVDVKVAALDEDWSGLRLVWRRELRQTS